MALIFNASDLSSNTPSTGVHRGDTFAQYGQTIATEPDYNTLPNPFVQPSKPPRNPPDHAQKINNISNHLPPRKSSVQKKKLKNPVFPSFSNSSLSFLPPSLSFPSPPSTTPRPSLLYTTSMLLLIVTSIQESHAKPSKHSNKTPTNKNEPVSRGETNENSISSNKNDNSYFLSGEDTPDETSRKLMSSDPDFARMMDQPRPRGIQIKKQSANPTETFLKKKPSANKDFSLTLFFNPLSSVSPSSSAFLADSPFSSSSSSFSSSSFLKFSTPSLIKSSSQQSRNRILPSKSYDIDHSRTRAISAADVFVGDDTKQFLNKNKMQSKTSETKSETALYFVLPPVNKTQPVSDEQKMQKFQSKDLENAQQQLQQQQLQQQQLQQQQLQQQQLQQLQQQKLEHQQQQLQRQQEQQQPHQNISDPNELLSEQEVLTTQQLPQQNPPLTNDKLQNQFLQSQTTLQKNTKSLQKVKLQTQNVERKISENSDSLREPLQSFLPQQQQVDEQMTFSQNAEQQRILQSLQQPSATAQNSISQTQQQFSPQQQQPQQPQQPQQLQPSNLQQQQQQQPQLPELGIDEIYDTNSAVKNPKDINLLPTFQDNNLGGFTDESWAQGQEKDLPEPNEFQMDVFKKLLSNYELANANGEVNVEEADGDLDAYLKKNLNESESLDNEVEEDVENKDEDQAVMEESIEKNNYAAGIFNTDQLNNRPNEQSDNPSENTFYDDSNVVKNNENNEIELSAETNNIKGDYIDEENGNNNNFSNQPPNPKDVMMTKDYLEKLLKESETQSSQEEEMKEELSGFDFKSPVVFSSASRNATSKSAVIPTRPRVYILVTVSVAMVVLSMLAIFGMAVVCRRHVILSKYNSLPSSSANSASYFAYDYIYRPLHGNRLDDEYENTFVGVSIPLLQEVTVI